MWRPAGDRAHGESDPSQLHHGLLAVHSHFLYMVLFATAVGGVLGAMLRSEVRQAARLAMWITFGLVGTALALAWMMYFISP